MVKKINESGGNAHYVEDLKTMKEDFYSNSNNGKRLYLTLGAGSIGRQIRELL